jgi:hypothetical protein
MSNEKQQSPVVFAFDQLTSENLLGIFTHDQQTRVMEILEQAKEMEKEQNDKPLDEKLFNLANEFAVAGYGDVAVRLHSIHTNL